MIRCLKNEKAAAPKWWPQPINLSYLKGPLISTGPSQTRRTLYIEIQIKFIRMWTELDLVYLVLSLVLNPHVNHILGEYPAF